MQLFSLFLSLSLSLDLFLDLFFCSLSSILAEADAFRPFPILWPIHKDLNSTLVLGLSCPSSAKWTAIWKIAESLLWLDPLRDPILFDTMPSRFRRCPLRRWTSSCRLASFEIPNLFLNRIFRYVRDDYNRGFENVHRWTSSKKKKEEKFSKRSPSHTVVYFPRWPSVVDDLASCLW